LGAEIGIVSEGTGTTTTLIVPSAQTHWFQNHDTLPVQVVLQ
jgi:hypothetical protein